MVNFDHEKVGKIPVPNNEWDTIVKDYGYDRIAKTEGSAVELEKGVLYEFRKNTVIQFKVEDEFVDIKWNPDDVINKSST